MVNVFRAFRYMAPGRVEFGVGLVDQVGALLREQGAHRVLLVTDPGLRATANFERVTRSLAEAGLPYTVYAEVESDPSAETCRKGSELLQAEGCDFILALGGGSAIDCAKAIGWMTTNPGPVKAYEGADKIQHPPVPMAAIPTSAGTGSEVTASSIITDRERKYKVSVRSPLIIPRLAILDPTLLATLPRHLAAWTGMDALTHALEAYTSAWASLVTDALALGALELIGSSLRPFVARRDNLEAASRMLVASTMAGMAFTWARVATVHALAHPVGAHHRVHHGLANAILLPHVVRFNLPGNLPKFARAAQALGERTEGLSLREAAERCLDAIIRLEDDLGIPRSLAEVGVTEESIPAMVRDALESGLHAPNPVETTEQDMVALYRAALAGR